MSKPCVTYEYHLHALKLSILFRENHKIISNYAFLRKCGTPAVWKTQVSSPKYILHFLNSNSYEFQIFS